MLEPSSIKTTQIYAKIVDTKISNDMNQLRIKIGNQDNAQLKAGEGEYFFS